MWCRNRNCIASMLRKWLAFDVANICRLHQPSECYLHLIFDTIISLTRYIPGRPTASPPRQRLQLYEHLGSVYCPPVPFFFSSCSYFTQKRSSNRHLLQLSFPSLRVRPRIQQAPAHNGVSHAPGSMDAESLDDMPLNFLNILPRLASSDTSTNRGAPSGFCWRKWPGRRLQDSVRRRGVSCVFY